MNLKFEFATSQARARDKLKFEMFNWVKRMAATHHMIHSVPNLRREVVCSVRMCTAKSHFHLFSRDANFFIFFYGAKYDILLMVQYESSITQ